MTTHYSLLATRYSLLATCYSPLTTHHSLLTTCHLLRTTRYAPLATPHSPESEVEEEDEGGEEAHRPVVAQYGEGGEGVGAAEQRVASLGREQIRDMSPPRAALLAHEARGEAAVTERDEQRQLEDRPGATRGGEQRAWWGLGRGLRLGLEHGLGLGSW